MNYNELWGACSTPLNSFKFETIFFVCQTFLLLLADGAGPRLNRASAEYIISKFVFRFLRTLEKINPSFGCFQTLLFLPFIVPAISHFMFTLHQPSSAIVNSSSFLLFKKERNNLVSCPSFNFYDSLDLSKRCSNQ